MRSTTLLVLLSLGCSDTFDGKGDEPAGPDQIGSAPTATLTAPSGSGPWYSDQDIALAGTVADAEDAAADLRVWWATEEDGDLEVESAVGEDGSVIASVRLADGPHTLVLHVEDADGNTASDRFALTVGGPNAAPACAITAPVDGAAVAEGGEFIFEATATDADISAERLRVVWSSDIDGELRTSTPDPDGTVAFATSDLSTATHRVSLLVTDEVGATCGDSLFVTVGSPPSLVVDSPGDGHRVNEGEAVSFTGSVSDAEDRPEDLQLSWTSSLDGEFSTTGADSTGALALSHSGLQPGEHSLEVTATDSDGLYAVDRRTLTVNAVPTAPTLALSPDPAKTDDDLVVVASGSTDPDGSGAVTYAYTWTEDGAALTETGDTLSASATAKGRTYRVTVTPWDDLGAGTSAYAERTVSNTAPALTGPTLSASSVQVGDVLTCTASATDADAADTPTIRYAWQDGSTGPTYTVVDTDDPGDTLTCTATADDGDGGTDSATASATVANTSPVVDSVSVTPSSGQVGDTLTCAASASDADGGSPSLAYAWSGGGSGATYTIQASDDPGDTLTCTVTATDTDGGSGTGSDSATVDNTAPVLGAVSISPASATNDDTLTCSAAATDADGDTPTITYAWSGAVAGSLGAGASVDLAATTVASDEAVTCTATAADPDGGVDSASAALTTSNRAPSIGVSLAPATPTAGDTLTCTATAGDDDGDTPTVSFAWTVDGSAVSATSTGGGASTLAGAFSRGDLVRCSATADDGKGGTDTDSADLTIANTPPTLSVSLLPSSATTDTVLTANTVSADDDGDTVTLTYAWTVSGTVVASGASDSLDGATAFDRGDTVSVTVTADDGADTASATSTTLTVANSAPGAPVVSISPADPEEGEDLLCSVDTASTDADGDAISYTVSWAADGVSYAAGSGWIGPFTTSLTDDSVDGADTLEGETWTCTVTPDDGTDTGTAGTDSVDIDMAIVSGDVSLSITGQDFVSIEAGSFDMGCTTAQAATGACSSHESPVQTVTLTHDFWLGQTEVTQDLFETTMGYNPSWFPSASVSSCTAQCPVETINWHEAAAMANALSAAEALTECYTCSGTRTSVSCAEAMDPYSCDGYRLPTEAEWEYAARAGTDLLYAGSDAIDDVAWWNRTYGSYWTTRAVAGKLPNGWNLYDMSGNVMEWTHDARITYGSAGVVDPNGGTSGCKVLRGGAAGHQTTPYLRVSHRDNCGDTIRYTGGGMRLARTIGG